MEDDVLHLLIPLLLILETQPSRTDVVVDVSVHVKDANEEVVDAHENVVYEEHYEDDGLGEKVVLVVDLSVYLGQVHELLPNGDNVFVAGEDDAHVQVISNSWDVLEEEEGLSPSEHLHGHAQLVVVHANDAREEVGVEDGEGGDGVVLHEHEEGDERGLP